jgi:hypothetical protein
MWRAFSRWVRDNVVLTKQEKLALLCVFGALLLGVVTQHYRGTHPRTIAPTPDKTRKAAAAKAPKRTASPTQLDEDDE